MENNNRINTVMFTKGKRFKKPTIKNNKLYKSRQFFDNKILGVWVKILFSTIFAFFLLIATEAITFNSYSSSFALIKKRPGLFLFDLILILTVLYFFTLIVKRLSISITLTSILFIGLSIANLVKFNSNDAPIYPWDLLQIKDIGNITGFASESIKFTPYMFWVLAFILPFLILAIVFDFKVKYRPLNIVKCVCIIIIFVSFVQSANIKNNLIPKMGGTVEKIDENHDYIFKNNGFISGFMVNLMYSVVNPPEGYTKENMELLKEKYALTSKEKQDIENLDLSKTPNIVVLLSETFWDPRNLPGVTLSINPISNYERLSLEGKNGNMAVTSFGGGTIGTEFEVLTGFSSLIMLPGTYPYQQYVRKPIETLPSYFKYLGYETTSIHPFKMDFYNRHEGHGYMGFEKSVFLEDLKNPEFKGPFVSDKYYTDLLIDEIKNVNKEGKPLFLYGASMQNHQAYNKEKYNGINLDITASHPDLTPENNDKITAFAQGVFDADKELGRLCDFLKTQDRETIVLFFGDHLPTLGLNKAIYFKTGYLKDDIKALSSKKQVMLPYLIWSNKQNIPDDNLNKSACLLGENIFEFTNIPKMPIYKMLQDSKKYYLGVNEKVSINEKGEYVTEITSEKGKEFINIHKQFTYDLILGKGYQNIGFLPSEKKVGVK